MSDKVLREQAEAITLVLPRLLHRLFVLDADDPTANLPLGQLRVCTLLAEGPRTISELGRELDISLSAATQLADRLERVGLVERRPQEGDRRVRSLRLMPAAVTMMRLRHTRRVRRVMDALERLPADAREGVALALAALRVAAWEAFPEQSPGPAAEEDEATSSPPARPAPALRATRKWRKARSKRVHMGSPK